MSSIRPLVTITVLALVGVFLYMKIDETEPPLPVGVDDWSSTADIDFDMGGDMGGVATGMAGADAIPQFASPQSNSAPSAGEAPAFGDTSAAPAFGDSAPKFEPAPVATTPAATAPAFGTTASSDTDDTGLNLPPLPTLPPAPSTAPSVADQAALPSVPNVNVDLGTSGVPPSLEQPALPSFSDAPLNTPSSTPDSTVAPTTPTNLVAPAQASLFSVTRLAVQAALDRGELSQALLQLSDWYGDPSLSASESSEVNGLLSQLAGSVIYSTEHRLEPPYMVQAGERLEMIAKKYEIPWQLLAKINGITSADQLQPGQQLKVMRGPFSALIDLSHRKLTLMLDRRYAGEFSIDVDPSVSVEEGHWEVNQKLLTPASAAFAGTGPTTPTEERSLMLSSATGAASQVAILRGATAPNPLSEPAGRVIRLSPNDASDIFDILSLGSKVVIRR